MLKYVPNALTILRFLLIPIIIIACAQGQYIIAIIVLTISGLTDILDGTIARKYNLFMTCGSDYHGKNKTVKLLEMSCDGTKAKQEDIIVNQIFEHTI